MKRYFGGCDVGSTYTKCVILDEEGKMAAHTTIKSKMNSEKAPGLLWRRRSDRFPDLIPRRIWSI